MQVLDANKCFEKRCHSALSLQLAAYYYSLQIYALLRPCFKNKNHALYQVWTKCSRVTSRFEETTSGSDAIGWSHSILRVRRYRVSIQWLMGQCYRRKKLLTNSQKRVQNQPFAVLTKLDLTQHCFKLHLQAAPQSLVCEHRIVTVVIHFTDQSFKLFHQHQVMGGKGPFHVAEDERKWKMALI